MSKSKAKTKKQYTESAGPEWIRVESGEKFRPIRGGYIILDIDRVVMDVVPVLEYGVVRAVDYSAAHDGKVRIRFDAPSQVRSWHVFVGDAIERPESEEA